MAVGMVNHQFRGVATVKKISNSRRRRRLVSYQSSRSPKVVALFSATNFSNNIIELLQLYDAIQIKWNYA